MYDDEGVGVISIVAARGIPNQINYSSLFHVSEAWNKFQSNQICPDLIFNMAVMHEQQLLFVIKSTESSEKRSQYLMLSFQQSKNQC